MVRSREAPAAYFTLEGFSSRMFPIVSGQLIRPGKAPEATGPGAQVRFLTGVYPLVGLQV